MERTSDAMRSSSPGDSITICYAVTHNMPYPRHAATSLYSAARSTPDLRVRLMEVDGGDYPFGIMTEVLPGADAAPGWVLMLDADTWINGDLRELLRSACEVNLRVAHAWVRGHIRHPMWQAILDRFGLPAVPVYANGLILCRWYVSELLRDDLRRWMRDIPATGLPDPLKLPSGVAPHKRQPWWMRDQYALSAAMAQRSWKVRELTSKEFSWNYAKESGGIVHHTGGKIDPFEAKRWPNFQKA